MQSQYLGNVNKLRNLNAIMVDRQNGQSVAQAEAQVQTLEAQIASTASQLGMQEQQLRQTFIPGTIESQFRLGSAQALRQARAGLATEQQIGLQDISLQRGEIQTARGQVRERRAEIARVKAQNKAIADTRREQERLIRIAKVERKIAITKAVKQQERAQATGLQSIPIPTQTLGGFELQALSIGTGQVQTLAAPSDLAPRISPALQTLARPVDLGITPSISSPTSFLRTQEQIDLPARRGGVVPITQAPLTAQAFVTAPRRGAIISQFTAPTRDPFISPFLGPGQEFLETRRATQLEAERTASFAVGLGARPEITEAGFQTGLADIRRRSITQAREEFAALPQRDIARAQTASLFQVPTRLGASGVQFAAEVIGGLGQQDPRQRRRVELGEETLFGRALAAPFLRPSTDILGRVGPQAIGTGALIVPAVGVGVGQFVRQARQVGVRKAGAETISAFSPLSLRSGALIPQTQFQTFSATFPGRDTTRRVAVSVGTQDPRVLSIRTEQLRATDRGVTGLFLESTQFPVIDIAGGGGFITPSTRVITRRGTITGGAVDVDLSILAESPRGLLGGVPEGQFGLAAGRTLSQPLRQFDILPGGRVRPEFIAESPRFTEAESLGLFRRTGRVTRTISREGTGLDIRFDSPTRDTGVESLGRGGLSTRQRPPSLDLPAIITQPRIPRPTPRPTRAPSVTLDIVGVEARRIGDLPTIVGGRGLGTQATLGGPRQVTPVDFEPSTGPLELGLTRPTGRQLGAFDLGVGVRGADLLAVGVATGQVPLSRARTGLGSIQLGVQAQAIGLRQFQPSAQATAQAQRTAQRFRTPLITELVAPTTPTARPRPSARAFRPIVGFGLPLVTPTLGGFGVPSRPTRRRRAEIPIRPSFTASVLDLTAFEAIPVDPTFGISPFEIRRRLVRKPKKKKTSKKKKVTKKKKKR